MNASQQSSRPVRMVLLVMGMLFVTAGARAQSDLETTLKQFDADGVKGYIQPIADLFGANMNAGLYHSAKLEPAGFHIALDIVAMGANVGDDQKTYNAKAPAGFEPTFKTATVFGGKKSTVRSTIDTSLSYSGIADGILNTSLFPLAAPQVTLGYIYGTSATLRFVTVPSSVTKSLGSITLFGLGVQHSVSQYLPEFPVDLSGGLFYSRFSVGDFIDFNSIAFGAQASKKFAVLAVYGGLQYESSTMSLEYTSSSSSKVNVDLDGANTIRFTLGAGLDLVVLHVFADANFGSITNFSAGIGFGGY